MRRNRLVAIATASLVGAALLPLTAGSSGASPAPAPASDTSDVSTDFGHTPPAPKWKQRYDAIRRQAVEQRVRTGNGREVQKLGKGVYGRAATTGTERVFVLITEFGGTEHSAYPDGESNAERVNGPRHNQIPKPDRTQDNSTNWNSDYNKKYYDDLYFNQMKKFWERESSGKYSVDGEVTQWVKVPFNEARYGRDVCGDIVCNNTWFLVRDAMAYWVQGQLDAGWTMKRVNRYLRTYDELDRYDFDGDGDFEEPDGYIDRFQVVHAGGDQADGDPIYGEDAIWSHRWNAQIVPPTNEDGSTNGPVGGAPIGGVQVGMGGTSDPDGANVQIPDNPAKVWVNDYTIQAENGGLSTVAHEYAHDLDLPDLYDTSGNTGGAENSVGFWSLMSQSRGTLPQDDGIGERAMPMAAWDKLQLGWLDYSVANPRLKGSTHKVRPAQSSDASSVDDGVVVLLPDKKVVSDLGAPCATCGGRYFYSDSGNDLNNTMTATVADGGALTAQVRYEIEDGWDYAFLEASSDGGQTWTGVDTSENYAGEDASGLDPDDVGISGNTGGEWVELTATVPTGTNALRWRYVTDSAFVLPGFQVDNIVLGGTEIGTAETDDEGWQLDGFRTTTGEETNTYLNAYIVENRQYVGGDTKLANLYNFAGEEARPNWVDFFKNSPGALINYWDSSQTDNNVGDHPGEGLILPVDANPTYDVGPDGTLLRPRIATRDSTFSLSRTKRAVLHQAGVRYVLKSLPGQPMFDDMLDWWQADAEGEGTYDAGWYGVNVPKTGTTVKVVRVNKAGVMTVRVR